jgi:hypothetical protein
MNNHVFALLPVNGSGDPVLVTSLKRINHTNNFILPVCPQISILRIDGS